MNIKHLIMIIKELFKPTARCPSSWTTSRRLLWNFTSFKDFVFVRLKVVDWAIWAGLKKLSLISCPLDFMSSSLTWLTDKMWSTAQQYQAYHCWIFSRILLSMFSFDCQTKLVKKKIATHFHFLNFTHECHVKSWQFQKLKCNETPLYQKLESPESTEYQGDGIHHHQFSSPAETSVFWESESCANDDFPKLSIWVKVKVTVKVMHGDAKSGRACLLFKCNHCWF